ncbi:hypothetical protein HMPREF3230_00853 [Gardnerella vaginalis]|uniref:Uncharacterized protein n=1 Tax=Gardnerella vaginalis TaxID=2702 RepID=A0A135Z5C4_GARVA|nr:hypothetical protein HMPREF3230_00853 [Gardnerella vaginalis]
MKIIINKINSEFDDKNRKFIETRAIIQKFLKFVNNMSQLRNIKQ